MKVLVALMVFCSILAGCGPKAPEPKSDVTVEISRPKSKVGYDLFLCIDESGSMLQTDPRKLRHDAARYFIQNLLVKEADSKYPHRVGIIPFDDVAYGGELVDLHPPRASTIAERLAAHTLRPQGNTSFVEALHAVRRSLDRAPRYPNPRRTAVIIFTDGEPDDKRRLSLQAYFDELKTYISASFRDVNLYVIGIDQTPDQSRFGRTVAAWRKLLGQDHVILIEKMEDLYIRFNDTVRKIFELTGSPPDVMKDREERTFEVMPYLSTMEVHVFSEGGLRLKLFRPDGSLVEAKKRGVDIKEEPNYRIILIPSPEHGIWRYQTEGVGQVKVFRNEVPFRMTLLSPHVLHPLGKPIRLKAEFATDTGDPIRELPEIPLRFTARLVSPEQAEETAVEFNERIGSIYYGNREAPALKPGNYSITIEIHGGQKFKRPYTEVIEVREFPYFVLERPKLLSRSGFSSALEVTGRLYRKGAITDPVKEFWTNPNSLVLVRMAHSPGGQKSAPIWLNYTPGDQTFRGRLRFKMSREGAYTLVVELRGEPRLPSSYQPSFQVEAIGFYIARDWIDYLQTGLMGLGALVVLWLVVVVLWLFARRKYVGALDLKDDAGTVINVNNRRFVLPPRAVVVTDNEGRTKRGKIWLVAHGTDAVKAVWGGWMSVMLFGLFGSRCIRRDLGQYVRVGPVEVLLS
jgi:Mg-chelatase subunit ChlD